MIRSFNFCARPRNAYCMRLASVPSSLEPVRLVRSEKKKVVCLTGFIYLLSTNVHVDCCLCSCCFFCCYSIVQNPYRFFNYDFCLYVQCPHGQCFVRVRIRLLFFICFKQASDSRTNLDLCESTADS